MESISLERTASTASTATSRRSLLSRIRRESSTPSAEETKGPVGLNTLSDPAGPVIADLVFVHGLGGGSQKTWTKSNDPSLFWPKEWLPQDHAFYDVRIHSFGYNANWDRGSTLNIYDFAKSLLGSIQDCPSIPRDSTTPLILVGHSMGGLVMKRAFIVAKQKEEFSGLADRIKTMVFLATPHRGADLAQLLTRMLTLSSGSRPFVKDLHRSSLATQSINDEFPQYCQDLQLYSFYETMPTSIGMSKSMVVDKDLAILGYANERTSYLDANHRGVCKFDSTSDPNYRTIRNTLAYAIEPFRDHSLDVEIDDVQQKLLDSYLGVSDAPEDDLLGIDNLRIAGSCEWFIQKESFKQWKESPKAQLLWLTAKPATGKTVLSGKIVNHLRSLGKDCQFYFFNHGDKTKGSISSFLLAMAWQMSFLHPEVFSVLLKICEKETQLSKTDYRTIWRKLFLQGIVTVQFTRPQYWVIDGLDECKSDHELAPLLQQLVETDQVRIFLTSRNGIESHRLRPSSQTNFITEEISESDTKSDISLYLNAHIHEFPLVDEYAQREMVTTILTKSAGCFLWVKLVIQELRRVHTSGEIRQVLETVPSDMNKLYSRILESMSEAKYGKHLAKAILVWTVCATRPLTTDELYHALEIDLSDTIDSIQRSILSSCGQLVYVDSQSRVQIVHQTAKDFLLDTEMDSEFKIYKRLGHTRLVKACLSYLNGREIKAPFARRLAINNISQEKSAFAHYANTSWYQHLIHVPSTDDDVMEMLAKFLSSSNVLVWIETIAGYSDLNLLIQAGKILRNYLQRRSTHTAPVSKVMALIDTWSNDLVRLVTKFGKKLLSSPSAIYNLIPPFCPRDTSLRKQFGSSSRGMAVQGLSATTWDDCLSTIVEPEEFFLSLATSEAQFAIGMSSGKIIIHDQTTCQRLQELNHHESVRVLKFSQNKGYLASAGSKALRLWNWTTGEQVWEIRIPQHCLLLEFADEDQLLLGVFRNNQILIWDLTTQTLQCSSNWTEDMDVKQSHAFRTPIFATLSPELDFMAIIYRGQDICIWDLEQDTLYETYSTNMDSQIGSGNRVLDAGVICAVFCRDSNASLLAASYSSGDLVLFDTSINSIKKTTVANAQTLASSPDGRTLASGDSAGIIQLYEFETLKLLYRISSEDSGIKELAFSGDGHYLLDIRASQCQVWDPPVLVRHDLDEENSDTVSVSTSQHEIDARPTDDILYITALACNDRGEFIFCGREDGSVYLYSNHTGLPVQKLFSHARGVSIISLQYNDRNSILTSVDDSGRVMSHKFLSQRWDRPELIFDHRARKAVHQILSNIGHTRLLVSSDTEDTLWSVAAQGNSSVTTLSWEERGSYKWARHSSNDDQCLLIANNTLYLYEWATFQRIGEPKKIELPDTTLSELNIRSITSVFGQKKYLATAFSERLRPQFISRLFFWYSSDWGQESGIGALATRYDYLQDSVRYLIGDYEQALIFLDNDGWVCSAYEQSANHTRHFFLPGDWLSTNITLMIKVAENGDIIFVKNHEVAIIKRGLDLNQRSTTGKRPSLAGWRQNFSSSRSS